MLTQEKLILDVINASNKSSHVVMPNFLRPMKRPSKNAILAYEIYSKGLMTEKETVQVLKNMESKGLIKEILAGPKLCRVSFYQSVN